MPNQKVKLVSDGTPGGTRLFLPDGSELKNIRKIEITASPGVVIAHVELIVINPQLDFVVDAEVTNVK